MPTIEGHVVLESMQWQLQKTKLTTDIFIVKMAASYTFEDLSGATPTVSDNPYNGLIEACHDNSASS